MPNQIDELLQAIRNGATCRITDLDGNEIKPGPDGLIHGETLKPGPYLTAEQIAALPKLEPWDGVSPYVVGVGRLQDE